MASDVVARLSITIRERRRRVHWGFPGALQGSPRATKANWADVPGCQAGRLLYLRPDEADSDGVANQPRHFVDAQPVHQLGPVGLDRLATDAQPPGDRFGRHALGHQPEDLALRGVSPSDSAVPPVRRR